jgi:hypothetical protein
LGAVKTNIKKQKTRMKPKAAVDFYKLVLNFVTKKNRDATPGFDIIFYLIKEFYL